MQNRTSPARRLLLLSVLTAAPLIVAAEDKVDFSKQILPILEQTCVKCHGADKQKGKLRLDNKEAALKGGKGGAIIKAGDAEASELYKRITLPKGHDDIMPSEGDPLSKAQTDLIRAWIKQGAVWPDGAGVAQAAATSKKSRPEPVLPADYKASDAETKAIAALGKSGIDVRPIAMNVPWREANLRLLGSNVTDTTLTQLKDVTSLVDLNLATTKITDAGLASLQAFPHLQKLHLEQTAVTDAGLAHLKGLTNLTYLNVFGTTVSDAGLDHLRDMKFLRNVYIWQTQVTDAGINKLKSALPEVQVIGGWDAAALAKLEEKIAQERAEREKAEKEKAEKEKAEKAAKEKAEKEKAEKEKAEKAEKEKAEKEKAEKAKADAEKK